jgi:hypothetical protein
MHKLIAMAGAAALAVAGGHCQAHGQTPHAHPQAGAHAALSAPDRSDPHVAQLYTLLKAAHAPGADHAALTAQLNAIADAHAAEVHGDPAEMRTHVMQVAHNAMMAAQRDPHVMDTVDTFYAALHAPSAEGHAAEGHAAHPGH